MEHFVEFEDVCKYYQTGSVKIAAADHLNFYVDKGEFFVQSHDFFLLFVGRGKNKTPPAKNEFGRGRENSRYHLCLPLPHRNDLTSAHPRVE